VHSTYPHSLENHNKKNLDIKQVISFTIYRNPESSGGGSDLKASSVLRGMGTPRSSHDLSLVWDLKNFLVMKKKKKKVPCHLK
jgi:hypothetical protein